ncbi:protein-arginine deiminase family protein [Nodosilinea sp. PGN35]|uniref:protein-arginine deiminase family protein n=1 Tax=Nodosilinea sp. PGN35 TaxID=3020489 RepID=UPI0023B2A913|nr:protein-arginine deiminase family protein [Nodosilinea sp. TSF1-S3]MDF0364776.1 protein-arginine deiminase family protein [Nodosilinea sp. TSF1-S3]
MRHLLLPEKVGQLPGESPAECRHYDDVLVVGQPLHVALSDLAPAKAVTVSLTTQGEIDLYAESDQRVDTPALMPLQQCPSVVLLARTFSDRPQDRSLAIAFHDDSGAQLSQVCLTLTCLRICLDVDADRDGVVDEDNPHKGDWRWGAEGQGAILLVNTDRDHIHSDSHYTDIDQNRTLLRLKDSGLMIARRAGARDLPPGCEIYLSVSPDQAQRICIYDELNHLGNELIGPKQAQANLRCTDQDTLFFVQGISYPDIDFDGLIEITLSLLKDGETVYSDRVVFRVAPWMMTPNTLAPIDVFVSRLSEGKNEAFIEDLRKVVSQAGAQLDPVPVEFHNDDPWMRDEIEVGYTQAPGKMIHVIFDSPRDRGLDHLAKRQLISSRFGYVIRKSPHEATKLDSFGNLEVSPPVTVNGVTYPFGRLLFGGTRPEIMPNPRRKLKVLRDFFAAQKIQAPVELFSDWLSVGHIDEFMNFVAAPNPKGFKLLLACPNRCYEVLKELRDRGHGQTLLREGKHLGEKPAAISVAAVLDDEDLAAHNQRFQSYIDWNREVLKQELGLDEADIIDLPALFEDSDGRAKSFFPNMVNMLVLNQHLAIPKPFGPKVNDKCAFEACVEHLLNPLGLVCHFIDDWETYFRKGGEIHCGTNTSRQPYPQKWWEIEPVPPALSAH